LTAESVTIDLETDDHVIIVHLTSADAGERLDKALARGTPLVSRARLQALFEQGAVSRAGTIVTDGSSKAVMGVYRITLPPVLAAEPLAEAIPLAVLHEDDALIVIDNRMAMTGTRPGAILSPSTGAS
jgi:23S rRNA pseudouridine1911/1915/1917 synthase